MALEILGFLRLMLDLLVKPRSDLYDVHRIADQASLSPERLSGSTTAMNPRFGGLSTRDDTRSP
jgi:hypothetical protein